MVDIEQTQIVVAGTPFRLVTVGQFLNGLKRRVDGGPVVREEPAVRVDLGDGVEPMNVWKSSAMVDQLTTLIDELQPRRIIELGIANGGSASLLAALAPQAKVVVVDIEATRVAALDEHIERNQLHERIRPFYGVDQSDRAALRRIVADEFGGEPIDLVIDDASHQIDATRASLDALFPLVRAGGCFLIEDWAWAHLDLRWVAEKLDWLPEGGPMSQLVYELMMVMGSTKGIVDRMSADDGTARFWKGPAELDPDSWSLAGSTYSVDPITLQ